MSLETFALQSDHSERMGGLNLPSFYSRREDHVTLASGLVNFNKQARQHCHQDGVTDREAQRFLNVL
jgi:hypothetical protein